MLVSNEESNVFKAKEISMITLFFKDRMTANTQPANVEFHNKKKRWALSLSKLFTASLLTRQDHARSSRPKLARTKIIRNLLGCHSS